MSNNLITLPGKILSNSVYGTEHLPILIKEYDLYKVNEFQNNHDGDLFFINVIPTSDNIFDTWSIEYKLYVTTPDNDLLQGYYECNISTAGSNLTSKIFNGFGSSNSQEFPIESHLIMRYTDSEKYQDRNNYPIKIGISVGDSLERLYKVEIYSTYGCSAVISDDIETYEDVWDSSAYDSVDVINAKTNSINYSDLDNTPTIPTVPTNISAFTNDSGYLTQHQDISGKADKVSNATNGNFAGLDVNGNLIDSGYSSSSFITQHQSIPEYTIEKLALSESGYSSSYVLKKNNIQVGATINIPKDMVVSNGEIRTVNTIDVPYQGAQVGDKYIELTIANTEQNKIYIPVKDLVDVYTEGNGININSSNVVSIKIDQLNSNGLSVGENGLSLSTVTTTSSGAMSSADKSKLDGIASGAEINIQSDWNQTNTSADDYIKNKPTNVSVFNNDAGYLTQHQDISGKADKVSNATNGNIASLDSSGNLLDSGYSPSDFSQILMEKTFDPYTISANDNENGYLFFLNILPTSDNYFHPWKIKYRLFVTTTENQTQGIYDCELGSAGTTSTYSIFNRFYSTSYYPIYSHLLVFYNTAAKYANREINQIKIGARVNSSRTPTTLARTFKIQVFEAINCEVSFPENIEKYGNIYTDAKYGYCSTIGATGQGLQETGDTNYPNYYNYEYYMSYRIHGTDTPLYRYKLCGFDIQGRLVPITSTNQTNATIITKTPNTTPMNVSKGIVFYYSSTVITDINTAVATGTIYRSISSGNVPIAYNFNTANINNCDIYLVGSYNADTGMFTLDSSETNSYYLYAPNTGTESEYFSYFTEGKYYWLLGNTSSTQFDFLIDNPLFYFNGTRIISVYAQTNKTDKVSNATNGNFAGLDSNGNLVDSGYSSSSFITQHQDLSDYITTQDLDDAIDDSKVFWAEVNVTTFTEIKDAIDDGRMVMVKNLYDTYTVSHIDHSIIIFSSITGSNYSSFAIYNDNTWESEGISFEEQSYKITSISSSSDDDHYPTAKAVYDIVSTKYTKPSNGIPASDLASGVIPTNVSSFTNDAGYLTQHQSLTNYVQKSQTAGLLKNDGTVDTNTYLTQHQDISGKQDVIDSTHKLDYSLIDNTPTIPNETTVTNWGFTKNTGTVTGVKVNGITNNPTSGVVDIGTVITTETSLSKGTTSGSGNAVTDITLNGHQITLTKGKTFLESYTETDPVFSSSPAANITTNDITNWNTPELPSVSSSDNGKILMVQNGVWSLVTPVSIYSGSGTPSNSLGNDGDIYIQQ